MNYLGIDYGDAKIGVALATESLASPLTTLKTKKALQLIKQLVSDHKITAVVVGDCPADFLQNLTALVAVYQVDETLSSHDARQSLLHTSQKKRRVAEHAVAASVILQNWLDSQNQNL